MKERLSRRILKGKNLFQKEQTLSIKSGPVLSDPSYWEASRNGDKN